MFFVIKRSICVCGLLEFYFNVLTHIKTNNSTRMTGLVNLSKEVLSSKYKSDVQFLCGQ